MIYNIYVLTKYYILATKNIKNVDQFFNIGYALTHSELCSSWLCFSLQQNHILHDDDV